MPDRDSFRVVSYLKKQGYEIVPVNPFVTKVLGEKSYANLKEIPVKIDAVDIFRKPEEVPEIVDEAIAIGAKVIWTQLGIVNNDSAEKARRAGLKVVMSKCMLVEHKRIAQTRSTSS